MKNSKFEKCDLKSDFTEKKEKTIFNQEKIYEELPDLVKCVNNKFPQQNLNSNQG